MQSSKTPLNIWEGGWAENRAKAYGISEGPSCLLCNRTLLKEAVKTSDIADAAFAFVSGMLNKSTGNIVNVDDWTGSGFPKIENNEYPNPT
ncbi:hypothetical protein V8V91_09875 [Algoriphagus halophilus]